MYGRMNMYGELNGDEKERERVVQPGPEPAIPAEMPPQPAGENIPPASLSVSQWISFDR